MSELICITNRKLCRGDFLERIEVIAAERPAAIVLREKDLPETDYRKLAVQVLEICRSHQVPFYAHTYAQTAVALGAEGLHLPLHRLRSMAESERRQFSRLGASCHSLEDAGEAQELGCTYLIAGHIFPTDCKKGLASRGLAFLEEICRNAKVPVYAIGGISSQNLPEIKKAGARGGCVMSSLMECDNVHAFMEEWRGIEA